MGVGSVYRPKGRNILESSKVILAEPSPSLLACRSEVTLLTNGHAMSECARSVAQEMKTCIYLER